MGRVTRQTDNTILIDTAVTVLGALSHIWDIRCTVGCMVAPYMADEVRNTLVASAPESLVVVDHAAADGAARHFENVVTAPSSELSAELDASAEWLGVTVEEILLAALGRTFGRTRGDGAVIVDVAGGQPGVCRRVSLLCAAGAPMGPTEMLQGAHNSLTAASGHPDAHSEILLDVTGDASTLGKTPGKDEAAQKATLVATLGLEGAREEARSLAQETREAALEAGCPEGGLALALVDHLLDRTR